MKYPRVLVISNNSFSLSNSNGRTLGLLFKGWPKDKLCQFCISSDGPSWEICNNYFCVSDKRAVLSLLKLHSVNRDDLTLYRPANYSQLSRFKRTSIKSLIRHLIWSIAIWRKGDFNKWIKEFSPEVVLIQSGDTAFTHDLARSISKEFNAKLVFFNTEGVYFLKDRFLFKGFCDFIFFPIYKRLYRRSYRNAMLAASYAFYLNELIKKDNDEAFRVPGTVIYNTSTLTFHKSNNTINEQNPIISYFGNMSYNRSKVLVEVAKVIKSLRINAVFNVYGKGYSDAVKRLEECEELNYHGFIPYSEVIEVINRSDILLHVESQENEFKESLKYGFSTKIADCLSSGKPFLLYSSKDIACAQYLITNDCAWFADNPESLGHAILSILNDVDKRKARLENASIVSEKNHNLSSNCALFQERLASVVDN